jgi:glycosyltransferase involved in cell wall biosynthesis
MRIIIDISQSVYKGSGVARYVKSLVTMLISLDDTNEYVLFGSSWGRRRELIRIAQEISQHHPQVKIVVIPIPIGILEFMWNTLHVCSIEYITGKGDIYLSSDWIQAPTYHAKAVTTVHDLSVLLFPDHYDRKIVAVHQRRLKHVARDCDAILCDSQATKDDCIKLLNIPNSRLHVVYPGYGEFL